MRNGIICVCLLALTILASCTPKHGNNYTETADAYAYRLLGIGDGTKSAAGAEAMACEAVLRTSSDSVFFNSRYQAPKGFVIDLRTGPTASGKRYLSSLTEGDSVSLMVGKTCFFREYFDTIVPIFLEGDSLVKLDLKILRIMDHLPATVVSVTENPDLELQELQQIDRYLRQHYPQVEPDTYGIYTLERSVKASEAVSAGKRVRVAYSGFYLNGAPLDNGQQQLEFVFGTPDQLVRGLNIVIGSLKKGETTKIIVPSRLAFGETGSTNGSIPPYTPLLYNLTLIDIK